MIKYICNQKGKVIKSMRTVESLQARVELLKSRKRENGRIIRKLERQIRALQK